MREWEQLRIATDICFCFCFCDPHSSWQHGTNENFDGLLRQCSRRGTDLSAHSAADLDWVAAEINDRHRKRQASKEPIELIGDLFALTARIRRTTTGMATFPGDSDVSPNDRRVPMVSGSSRDWDGRCPIRLVGALDSR